MQARTLARMAETRRTFQGPKGTRDFYPQEMAARRYIEGVWRSVSIAHGFEEVEGPTFEGLELYTHKSGPGIVSEIFQVLSGKDEEQVEGMKAGRAAPYALRPEFTPTLARMVAAKASSLPMPVKWFAIPNHFRAERPQRGRLREFVQWNVDFIGEDSPRADAEVIATAVSALERLGLQPTDVRVKISNRNFISALLRRGGIAEESVPAALELLDKRGKLDSGAFDEMARARGMEPGVFERMSSKEGRERLLGITKVGGTLVYPEDVDDVLDPMIELDERLGELGMGSWCEIDHSIVRGLAYYTGTVFEIHEARGAERAIAGGGRYDNLIESFGGPKLSACGFGMGDVVLSLVLKDRGLLGEERTMEGLRPDAFVIAADDEAAEKLAGIVAELRRAGLHARHSYKSTRNVGKLLGEAGKCRARYAVIMGKELAEGRVVVKDLEGGGQEEVEVTKLAGHFEHAAKP